MNRHRIRILLTPGLLLLVGGFGASSPSATSSLAQVRQVATLVVTKPTAVVVNEADNKVYVAEGGSGTIQVFDGATHKLLRSIPDCAGILSNDHLVIDQRFGRMYAGCDSHTFPDLRPGDRTIRVIDTKTDRVVGSLDLGTQGAAAYFKLAVDNVLHRVFVSHLGRVEIQGSKLARVELAALDVATNRIMPIRAEGARLLGSISINERTGTVYVVRTHANDLLEVDGRTLSVSQSYPLPFPQGAQSAINQRQNKLYVKTIGGPRGRPTIVCLQLHEGAAPTLRTVTGNDWGGIVVNETTNRVYCGVEVGQHIGILEGDSDRVQRIPMEQTTGTGGSTGASHNLIVNEKTNRVFFVNRSFLLALDGASDQYRRIPYHSVPGSPSRGLPPGGLLLQAITMNRQTGQVYVLPDQNANRIAVFQDR